MIRTRKSGNSGGCGRSGPPCGEWSSDQEAARGHDDERRIAAEQDGQKPPDPTRFIFPAVDGGEMVARWDMQSAPPDILVTNPSMLGAMLSREIEDGIFAKTREWLENDPESYFFLILDELHLIRGSAGTEIAFLIKSLLERLGIDRPDLIHKVRILASSASLPLDGEADGPKPQVPARPVRALRDQRRRVGSSASSRRSFGENALSRDAPSFPSGMAFVCPPLRSASS